MPLLTPAERHRVLVEWNHTAADAPAAATIPTLFARQAAATPDATALIYEQREITYRELAARADGLAAWLRQRGVRRGITVAVAAPRSPELVVALLGVLGAGAAYLPLDPSYPADRRQLMLTDSGARLCLTGTEPTEHAEAAEPAGALATLPTPADLAYVVYTSGSTGRPKGVAVSHGALANLVLAMRDLLRMQVGDRLLAVTTPSSDISAVELFVPLVTGAAVALLPDGLAVDGKAVAERLERHRVSVMQATPARWRILIESGWRGRLTTALCGGEALDATLAGDLVRRADHVWNVYGPTEATVWAACAPVHAGAPVTIGRPIANTQLYVLDDDLEPAPVGVAGELYIGGTGLAWGYVGRPGLTAQRFGPDPFGRGRLYRTGDMARWRPDGALEFLGRMDRQVMVRGHRIELGEIENLLCAHPAVLAAAVTARGDGKQLVAYVVIDEAGRQADRETDREADSADRADRADRADDDAIPTSELRAFLSRALPDYLLPNAFVRLAALPLTPSGKVDRRALPPPDLQNGQPTGPAESAGSGEPQTRTERLLAGIWRSVLDLPHVDADDNFFEIGGHSLAIVSVHARLAEALGREISVVDLFRYANIRALAAFLEDGRASKHNKHEEPRAWSRTRTPASTW